MYTYILVEINKIGQKPAPEVLSPEEFTKFFKHVLSDQATMNQDIQKIAKRTEMIKDEQYSARFKELLDYQTKTNKGKTN